MTLPLAHLSASDLTACAALLLMGFAAGAAFACRYLVPRKHTQSAKVKR